MVWDKDAIRTILNNPEKTTGQVANSRIIFKMLQSMFERQTADEQSAEFTKHRNNVGFNGVDSNYLSSVAKTSKKYNNLTPKQAVVVGRMLKKYAGQLVEIAASKHSTQTTTTLSIVEPSKPQVVLCSVCEQAPAVTPEGLCESGGCSDIYWSNEFGRLEARQEAEQYMREVEFQGV